MIVLLKQKNFINHLRNLLFPSIHSQRSKIQYLLVLLSSKMHTGVFLSKTTNGDKCLPEADPPAWMVASRPDAPVVTWTHLLPFLSHCKQTKSKIQAKNLLGCSGQITLGISFKIIRTISEHINFGEAITLEL